MKTILIIFVLFFSSNVVYSNTYAVKFDERSIFADLTIKVSKTSLFVDETWKIVGSCKSAFSYSTVKISQTAIFADLTVKISQSALFPDKRICIKNPNSLPSWFLEIINN